MIPIYYDPFETSFTTNGKGRLLDCSSCIVTEERNGIYECEFQYPITGRFYQELITDGGVVGVIHDDHHDIQPFEIYKHSAPIDGVVTFNAHHISYRLGGISVKPFSASSCALALQGLNTNSITTNPFTFWTDKGTTADFEVTHPDNIRALLAGQDGSVLDVFGGGDYEFDKFAVKLYASRGNDTGVTIRYGKNLADVKLEKDRSGTFTGIVPYYQNEDTIVTLSDWYVVSPYADTEYPWTDENENIITDENGTQIDFAPAVVTVVPMDFSNQFESTPTEAELRQAAEDYLANNSPWLPDENITVDFVQMWQTPEYENVAALQRVSLCDTVSVFYPELGVIQSNQKVIKTLYNVLLERFDSMELGQLKTTLAQSMTGTLRTEIEQTESVLRGVIEHATEMITGGLGGYVVMNLNADGEPQEILIMDTDDISTAVNVIRMNKNGIGFSTSGYNGPFASAWTIDGKFNADFIATGHLLANYIQGGTLTLGGLDGDYGSLEVYDENANLIGKWDKNGWSLYDAINSLTIEIGRGGFATYADDVINAPGGFWALTNPNTGSAHYGPGVLGMYDSGGTQLVSIGGASGGISALTLYISGTKSRVASTEDYSERLLYCYETPSPMFGDVGEGVIGEDGLCYVWLDPVFAETITTMQYQVFLQAYGEGSLYVTERKPGYFCVKGTPGLAFGWEIKAKQSDFDQLRLERKTDDVDITNADYGFYAIEYLEKLKGART